MVACNRRHQDKHIEHEPKLIIEVLSPGAEQRDRLGKLEPYTKTPSLEEYLLVDQRDSKIDAYRRADEHWQPFRYGEDNTLQLTSIGLLLSVNAIYQCVVGVV